MAGRRYVARKLYSLRAVFASICCSSFSILSVFRMYIRGVYAAIAVTRNMHQIAARKYCCIGSLLASQKFGNCSELYSVAPRQSRDKNTAVPLITTSCVGHTDQGSALNLAA